MNGLSKPRKKLIFTVLNVAVYGWHSWFKFWTFSVRILTWKPTALMYFIIPSLQRQYEPG